MGFKLKPLTHSFKLLCVFTSRYITVTCTQLILVLLHVLKPNICNDISFLCLKSTMQDCKQVDQLLDLKNRIC